MALKLPIYLDHHATTPVDPRVVEAMSPFWTDDFGNASSATHAFGWRAAEAVEQARRQVSRLIAAVDPKEVIWTSGTTESDNLALVGIAQALRAQGDHIITCVTEHRAVLDTAAYLERHGIRVTYLPVDSEGLIDPDDVRKALTDKTILISLMAANNEIGVLQPAILSGDIGKIAKERGAYFHVDAAQACGKVPIDVAAMGIDLLSMSAHKVYGPKGIGALYVRNRNPHVRLQPLFHGGGQERGLRPGTLAVPLIVGMGCAFEIASQEMREEGIRLKGLRERLFQGLSLKLDGVVLNGHATHRLPGNLNLSFLGVRSDALIGRVRDVALSSGSACASSETPEGSYVIRSLGGSEDRASSSIRFGIGRFNTEEEIDYVVSEIAAAVTFLRK